MLKRKLLMTILPVLSAAVIAGAGFSAWHFGTATTATDSATVNTVVEDATEYSVLVTATTKPTTLSLDQATFGALNEGINFTNGTSDTNLVLDVTTEGEDANFTTLDFEITVTLDGNLNEYLDFNLSNLSNIYTGLTTTSSATDASITLTLNDVSFTSGDDFTFALNNGVHNYLLDYATGKKPLTYTDWKTMNTALTGSSMTIGVSVTAE